MPLLSLRGVRKRFGATVALSGVDLVVEPGEVLALIGENGAGKSTLLNIVSGSLRPDEGEVDLGGLRVAYIRQELSLFPHLTVAENVFMGREPARFGLVDREGMRERTLGLMREFGRPDLDPGARVGDLPPASRQVVEICRALAADAQLILMDEPTSSLQRADVDRLFAAIRGLCSRGLAVIYVSHFLEEVREIASRAVVLRDGASVWEGRLDAVSDPELIAHMVGRSAEPPAEGMGARPLGNIVLEARDFAGASLEVRQGEIMGIAGLIGSGRTELLRALFGLDPVRAGTLRVKGRPLPVRGLDPATSIRERVGYLGEDRNADGLFPHLSVLENLTMTAMNRGGGFAALIDRLRIRIPDLRASIRQLSGGNQQKVLLARLLHQEAEILLLDEPTRGVDVGSKAEIYRQIQSLAAEGKAILIVSSYLPELFAVCDRLAVMSRGRLGETRSIGEWTPARVLEAAIGVSDRPEGAGEVRA